MKYWKTLKRRMLQSIDRFINTEYSVPHAAKLINFPQLKSAIKSGDILLVEGRSQSARVVSYVTRSVWTHSALCLGSLNCIEDPTIRDQVSQHYKGDPDEPLLIESLLEDGVIVVPVSKYESKNVRVCRPHGLALKDRQKLIRYVTDRLGIEYDARHIFDLFRFFIPWGIFPRRWQSSLFHRNAGYSTKLTCSMLIIEAYGVLEYPVLPRIHCNKKSDDNQLQLIKRNPRLFTPTDFDYSPFFTTLKFPLLDFSKDESFKSIDWVRKGVLSNDDAGLFVPDRHV